MKPPTRIETIRARARAHEEDLEALRWLRPQQLADRWGLAVTTIYSIPRDELPYKQMGKGKKFPRRRYHPDAVAAYEAAGLPSLAQSVGV